MAITNNIKEFLKDICDAIREKTGSSDVINAQSIPQEILNIDISGLEITKEWEDYTVPKTGTRAWMYTKTTGKVWTEYDYVAIVLLNTTTGAENVFIMDTAMLPNSTSNRPCWNIGNEYIDTGATKTTGMYSRGYHFIQSGQAISFNSTAYRYTSTNSSSNYAIPVKAYGIKGEILNTGG